MGSALELFLINVIILLMLFRFIIFVHCKIDKSQTTKKLMIFYAVMLCMVLSGMVLGYMFKTNILMR